MASRKRNQRGMSAGRVALIVVVAALLVGIGFIVKNIISLTIEKRALIEKNNELANKRDELTAELENVNDLDYIEEQARKLLHMIKPGEILYILDGSGNPDAGAEGNGIDLPEREEQQQVEQGESEEESSESEEEQGTYEDETWSETEDPGTYEEPGDEGEASYEEPGGEGESSYEEPGDESGEGSGEEGSDG